MRSARSRFVFAWLIACTPQAATDDPAAPVPSSPPPAPVITSPPAAQPAVPTTTRPLRRWMESDLLYRIRTKDFRGLARSLDALATTVPPDSPRWSEIAAKAARAAQDGDVEAVRRGCAACHQLYRVRFRAAELLYDTDRVIERSRT